MRTIFTAQLGLATAQASPDIASAPAGTGLVARFSAWRRRHYVPAFPPLVNGEFQQVVDHIRLIPQRYLAGWHTQQGRPSQPGELTAKFTTSQRSSDLGRTRVPGNVARIGRTWQWPN